MNAVKFSPRAEGGSVSVSVHLEAKECIAQAQESYLSAPTSVTTLEGNQSNIAPDLWFCCHHRKIVSVASFPAKEHLKPDKVNSMNTPIDLSTPQHTTSISESARTVCCSIVFEVTDRGCGIPEEVRGKIFTEFFQFDPDRLQGGGGSGLGLWLSREIVLRHGGDIRFRAGLNGIGTIFSVHLPAYCRIESLRDGGHRTCDFGSGRQAPCMMSSSRENDTISKIGIDEACSNGYEDDSICDIEVCGNIDIFRDSKHVTTEVLRVLIVDDSILNRKIMRSAIERALTSNGDSSHSIEFIDACDGETAVHSVLASVVSHCPYDFVFMDNVMESMNGPEAAQLMRRGGYKGNIIGVTGNVMPEDIDAYLRCGADRVLTKPVNQEYLKEILKWSVGSK